MVNSSLTLQARRAVAALTFLPAATAQKSKELALSPKFPQIPQRDLGRVVGMRHAVPARLSFHSSSPRRYVVKKFVPLLALIGLALISSSASAARFHFRLPWLLPPCVNCRDGKDGLDG